MYAVDAADGQTEHGHIVRRCVRSPRSRLHDLCLPARPIGHQPANSGIVTVSHDHYTTRAYCTAD